MPEVQKPSADDVGAPARGPGAHPLMQADLTAMDPCIQHIEFKRNYWNREEGGGGDLPSNIVLRD